jgi:hypothetical protein
VFDVEDIVDDNQDLVAVDENISCEPFASATPLEVDENQDDEPRRSSRSSNHHKSSSPSLRHRHRHHCARC